MSIYSVFKKIIGENKKFGILVLIVLSFTPILLMHRVGFVNDTCWLVNTGKYIIENGFPNEEPFTIHNGLYYTVQQWLSTVVFYLCYNYFGIVFLNVFVVILEFITCSLTYFTSMRLSDKNRFVSTVLTTIVVYIIQIFDSARPQMFSISLFAFEIYVLESYMTTDRKKYLILLPAISLLIINFHAAMWPVFFLLYIPNILERFRGMQLMGGFIVSFIMGFINPYGIENMFYVFKSYGVNKEITTSITEMASPQIFSFIGQAIFAICIIVVVLFAKKQIREIPLRHYLILSGTLYMALSSVRSVPLFIICAVPILANAIKDVRVPGIANQRQEILFQIFIIGILNIVIFFEVIVCGLGNNERDDIKYAGVVSYINQNLNKENLRMYNEYEAGGFLELSGIKTFIDSRAEVFQKSLNKKEDIMIDYLEVGRGRVSYMYIAEKYELKYFLISKGRYLDNYIERDSEFSKIYYDEACSLYELK